MNGDGELDMLVTYTSKVNNRTNTVVLLLDGVTGVFKIAFKFEDNNLGIFVADLSGSRGMNIVFYDKELKIRRYLYFENNKPIM